MKATKTFVLILSLLLPSQVFSQTNIAIEIILAEYSSTPFPQVLTHPIKVSPLIGEKLDRAERIYFNLFTRIQGFQEAVFYLTPDSSLNAKITYRIDEAIKDTVILQYMDLKKLQNHILNKVRNNVYHGVTKTVVLQLNDETEREGIMLSINQNSISLLDAVLLNTVSADNLDHIISKNLFENFDVVVVEEKGSVFFFVASGVLFGTVTGALIGSQSGRSTNESIPFEGIERMCIGSIIGALAGFVIGLVIGSNSAMDEEYEADEIIDFSELQKYTLIPNRLIETNEDSD